MNGYARVKVTTNTNSGAFMWIRDDAANDSWPKTTARVGYGGPGPSYTDTVKDFWYGMDSGPLGHTEEERSAYHIIRITEGYGPYAGGTVRVYMDENPTPVLSIDNSGGISHYFYKFDAFCFGILGETGLAPAADLWFDWVSFTNKGMFAPGEENSCIGTLLPPGACCLRGGGCDDLQPAECAARQGTFHGRGSVCANTLCCPDPVADADWDGDVDQADFAALQQCYTGEGFAGTLSDECRCFDRSSEGSDGSIDNRDYLSFEACASGPGISADPGCD